MVCLAVFATQYALDKFLFSKFYAIPQTMTNALALTFSHAIPYAVFLRSGVAIWMWTNDKIVDARVRGLGTMATPGSTGYEWFDSGDEDPVLYRRLAHRNARPHLVVVAVVVAMVLRSFLGRVLGELAFVRDSVAGLLARCGCFAFDAFFRDLVQQQAYDFPDYYAALSTACLERHLSQKILKKSVLKKYRAELDRRTSNAAPPPERAHVRIQGLETYNFRANPTYVAKFALDSKIIRMADAADYNAESLRGSGVGVADDWRPSDADADDVDFADTLEGGLPSVPGVGPDAERDTRRASVWVEEREPSSAAPRR